ncbi:MAG: FliM/FliN family flagellar motor switch protein [Gemmatimonadota bacterium]
MTSVSHRLSQGDIDAMVEGIAAPKTESPAVLAYNFRRPPRFSKDRRVTLDMVFGTFARNLQSLLSSRLREIIEVQVSSIEQVACADCLASLIEPCAAYVFHSADGVDHGFLDLGPAISFHVLDRIFGGPGDSAPPSRALSALEQAAVKDVIERSLHLLADAASRMVSTGFIVDRFESTSRTIRVAAPEDNLLVINLDIRTPHTRGFATLALPARLLDAISPEKAESSQQLPGRKIEDRKSRAAVGAVLQKAQLQIVGRSTGFQLRARELFALKAGDTIVTCDRPDEPIQVFVNDRLRWTGTVGEHQRALGIKLLDEHTTQPGLRAGRKRSGRIIAMKETEHTNGGAVSPGVETATTPAFNSLMEVSLPVVIEFGRTNMTVQQVLELAPGSVVQLDRMVGEPVDVYVSDRRLAEGEVVMVGEQMAIRVIRLVSDPAEVGAA